jgi:hypothetical protein
VKQPTPDKEEVSLPWPGRWSTAWSTSKTALASKAGRSGPARSAPKQVVYWPLHHKVTVKGQAEVLHVRAMNEVPVHLDDVILELTEADENWLTVNAIDWSGVVAR